MSRTPNFFWFELATSDVDAALAFYASVVGWTSVDQNNAGPRYAVVEAAGRGVGGISALNPAAPDSKPAWSGYIYSSDVDATARAISAAGGAVHYGPDDIPTVGRFAVVADPQGASFKLLAPSGEDLPPLAPYTPGHVGWNELHTTDSAAALAFYTAQFGWSHARDHDMGAMGTYRIFAIDGADGGGMMDSPLASPAFWLPYFSVGDIDAAHERVKAGGGSVMHGPAEVPGGGFIVQGSDPQGAMFALTGPRK